MLFLDTQSMPARERAKAFQSTFMLQGMAAGHRNAYQSIAGFSATDFRPDLDAIDVPTLVVHGDDDQVVPFAVGGQASAARIKNARLLVYPGAPHGPTDTHRDRIGRDLLDILSGKDA